MSTTTAARTDVFTYSDFCAMVRDDQKGDLIDGAIYMASPENIEANELFLWLATIMQLYVRKRKLGRVHGSRVACRLDDANAPEPDLLFVAEKNSGRLHRGGVDGPPDLAIEIVSPESVQRDYELKRRLYQRFAVSEYWIIDEHERRVTLLRLDARGRYREVAARKGIYRSQALAGFWLEPDWLWQRPLPDELEILGQLLAER